MHGNIRECAGSGALAGIGSPLTGSNTLQFHHNTICSQQPFSGSQGQMVTPCPQIRKRKKENQPSTSDPAHQSPLSCL